MQAVILAAGKGSRLQPLTLERSKAMMPIAGKAMITRVMEILQQAGLQEFIVVAHPEDIELKNLFSSNPNVKIVWQTERKGAAHALSYAAPFIQGDFVLSACDNLVKPQEAANFIQRFRSNTHPKLSGLLSLIRVPIEKIKSMGMVVWNGEMIEHIVEKPSIDAVVSDLASTPLYCFSASFLDYLPLIKPSKRGEYELQDAMQMLIDDTHNVHGMMFSGRWTVTDANDLLDLNLQFLSQEMQLVPELINKSIQLIQPCLFESGVELEDNCRIGPNVLIETGSKVGKGAVLRNALVLRGATVPAGRLVQDEIFT
ncbi:MAG: sugar phosphate nucleotidyltransferase [Chloroflexota bacterium]